MKNPASVMDGLHKISGTISANTRRTGAVSSAPATAEKSMLQNTNSATSPATVPTVPQGKKDAAARRRFEEYLRGRRDLSERAAGMIALLESEEAEQAVRAEKITSTLKLLRRILEDLPEADASREGFSGTAELADSCRKLENLRLETIRLAPLVRNRTEYIPGTPHSTPETKILLDSLAFRQIFRASLIASLPILIMLLLAAILIAAAVIGSFKGLF